MIPQPAPTFAVQLATAAEPAELAAWLEGARPGAWAIYASGADLPRAAAGVLLVGKWVAQGIATTSARRDPSDNRRQQFLVTKTRSGGPTAPLREDKKGGARAGGASPLRPGQGLRAAAPAPPTPPVGAGRAHHAFQTAGRNAARLLELLRDAAAAGAPCPSYAEVRDRLALKPGERGKQAARAIFRRLERERRVAVSVGPTAALNEAGSPRGPRGPRVVTILAKGRAQNMSTGGGQ